MEAEYMTFLEQLEKEREAGRAEERMNTEREKSGLMPLRNLTMPLRPGLMNLLKKFLSWKRNLNHLKLLSPK
jgi:hypothetical protein